MAKITDPLALEGLRREYLKLYPGAHEDFEDLIHHLKAAYEARPTSLRALDLRDPDWYLDEKKVGMMLYTRLFSTDLKGLIQRVDYFKELGITYLHLMPLIKPRAGDSDGGYAVEDYRDIDPELGTLEDFEILAGVLRDAGIDLCIDFVLNHTADTHEWAQKALAGDETYQDYYLMYGDRRIPDLYDAHVPQVLPDRYPGNFTYKEALGKWVYTSFADFQWDLNFKNPRVFLEMVDIFLYLANLGVTMIRLDAIVFVWKEEGTSCRNLAQAHDLMHLFHLIKEMVAPGVAILGEAIVQAEEIFKYFGQEDREECGLLYNANYMVNIFNAMATADGRLLGIDNRRFAPPKRGAFMNYVRCHDDIGWGFNEEAIASFGLNPYDHKMFLIDFYSRDREDSFARGGVYQFNPVDGDARTNGTLASLMGLEKARETGDPRDHFMALQRIRMALSLIVTNRGIPLLYSGDEIATLNDPAYLEDPHKAADSRWMHRPFFDWDRSERRHDLTTDEGMVFHFVKKIIALRKEEPLFNGRVGDRILDTGAVSVYSFLKEDQDRRILFIYNFSPEEIVLPTEPFKAQGLEGDTRDMLTDELVSFDEELLRVPSYGFFWLRDDRNWASSAR